MPELPLHAHDARAWDIQLFSPRTTPRRISINPAAQPSNANEWLGVLLRLGPQVRDGQGKTSWQPDEREKLGSFPQYALCPHCQDCSQEERMYDMILAPPAGSNHPRGGPGGHCRYPATGVPAPPMPKVKYL